VENQAVREAWLVRHELGRHEENVRVLEDLLATSPPNAELHMLLSTSLSGAGREEEASVERDSAVALAGGDPAILTRAAWSYFFNGAVAAARECADRAADLAPRDFFLRDDLREIRRNIARREKTADTEWALKTAFEDDPGQPKVGESLARLLARHGETYAAYVVVVKALRQRPDDAKLVKLRDKIARGIPADQRERLKAQA
jgi:Flp pilus assembly protein TadD